MLRVEETVLVLLAAGRSERWGDVGSKLDEPFLGRALGLHVAVALESMPFAERIAVTNRASIDYAAHGYRVLANDAADASMASSLRLGVGAAAERGAGAVLIALADMPRVTAAHVHRLFDATRGGGTVVASSDGMDPKPPALFGADRFAFLQSLTGDQGARALVAAGRHVVASPAELIDVDTLEELEELRELVRLKGRDQAVGSRQ